MRGFSSDLVSFSAKTAVKKSRENPCHIFYRVKSVSCTYEGAQSPNSYFIPENVDGDVDKDEADDDDNE